MGDHHNPKLKLGENERGSRTLAANVTISDFCKRLLSDTAKISFNWNHFPRTSPDSRAFFNANRQGTVIAQL